MRIAFTAKGTDWNSKIDSRFGRTDYLLLYDEDKKKIETIDNRAIANEAHGAGPQTAQKFIGLKPDILITGNGPGGNAALVLKRASVKVFIGASEMTVKEAYDTYQKNLLQEQTL
ncbi:MAG: hypothetical protein JXR46_09665 [Calditrichaceae bacterium]|nr:hypothetical protein [Calditrichaceae bacterium]MBN2709300.1 hypothetical protein [Calditrichaceae bacterium]RQV92003.1 MAG: dinitrogenase iron-molybdenum cofactor biosynthesis protein [Calditrichota bacterium]